MGVVLDLPQKLQDAYNIIAKEQEIPQRKANARGFGGLFGGFRGLSHSDKRTRG